ncbi:hypothetical protein MMC13_002149 [Lambiella insularis]|nr:hypothetical protein [Lambiella insularis]
MSSTSLPPPTPFASLSTRRSLRQLSLFLAGACFLSLSTLVTRRSVARRRAAIFPAFYHPSNAPPRQPINGALEALEALNIATINVMSFGIMVTGGALWAFDVSSMEDLRRRGGRGEAGDGRARGEEGGKEEEGEVEEWLVAGVAMGKEGKMGKEREMGKEGGGGEDGGVEERGRRR